MDLMAILQIQNDSGFIGPDYYMKYPGTTSLFSILIILSVLFGVVGNLLIFVSILTSKTLRNPGNMFLLSLATADIMVAGFVGPMNLLGIFKGELYFLLRQGLCDFTACLCLTVCFASVLNIAAISLNRYIFIVHNSIYERIYTWNKTYLYIALFWFAGFLMESPNVFGWGNHIFERKTMSCLWNRMAARSYTIFFAVVPIGTPIAATLVFYLLIFRHFRESSKRIAQNISISSATSSTNNKTRRLATTMFIIFFIFLVCWAPYAFIVVFDEFDQLPALVHGTSIIFAHINSSVNVFIYGYSIPSFRRAYVNILNSIKCSSERIEPDDLSTVGQVNGNDPENIKTSSI